jgi:hypothetical protein
VNKKIFFVIILGITKPKSVSVIAMVVKYGKTAKDEFSDRYRNPESDYEYVYLKRMYDVEGRSFSVKRNGQSMTFKLRLHSIVGDNPVLNRTTNTMSGRCMFCNYVKKDLQEEGMTPYWHRHEDHSAKDREQYVYFA